MGKKKPAKRTATQEITPTRETLLSVQHLQVSDAEKWRLAIAQTILDSIEGPGIR